MIHNQETLDSIGSILHKNEGRDAVHIACISVRATQTLYPGQHVGYDGSLADPIGIVDPFLTENVNPGQWFWLFMYPKTTTQLTHNWSHPKIDKIDKNYKVIEHVAYDLGITAPVLLQYTKDWLEYGDYAVEGGKFEGASIPEYYWEAYENYTKTEVDDNKKHTFLSCSC